MQTYLLPSGSYARPGLPAACTGTTRTPPLVRSNTMLVAAPTNRSDSTSRAISAIGRPDRVSDLIHLQRYCEEPTSSNFAHSFEENP